MLESESATAEEKRLEEARTHQANWRQWGPYLSERQWGTVREDYSKDASAWSYFPHDHARSRAYRWGEDGIAGISDCFQQLCFAIALWNGQDSILKERIFGLTGLQGNHGEDVKEYYFYLDNTPTHSYMKYLYKYPQIAFPYQQLIEENKNRDYNSFEFELLDTQAFKNNQYFDVFVEYAKASPEDILIQITISNRSSEDQTLHLLPTLWFRNTWSWFLDAEKPQIKVFQENEQYSQIEASHPDLGTRWLYCAGSPELLFTENETNLHHLFQQENNSPYVKDSIHDYVIHHQQNAVNPNKIGTKFSAYYTLELKATETKIIKLRLSDRQNFPQPFAQEFTQIFQTRLQEADQFYQKISPFPMSEDCRNVQRQAFAGLLWNKQYYHYKIYDWLKGDPAFPSPPPERKQERNSSWFHLDNENILSMPDKWEYPWYAAWDLAFHVIPIALIDPEFAKEQLDLLTREWYMHPNGQMPAYEWNFSDVNPPVHAWATWRVYKIEEKMYGRKDRQFLERVFQKLLINFTWWVNRKDAEGKNVFEGGFLGLDNIGVFDRSSELPTGGHLTQSDATSWMAMYCLNLMTIALELALENPVYEDIATKFFEHFLYIVDATNHMGGEVTSLWDDVDGFYYDLLHLPCGKQVPLKIRSIVGLIPLFAVDTIESEILEKLPGFKERLKWFIKHRPELRKNVACMETEGVGERRLLAIVSPEKLRHILAKMLDENEFLSEYGIRSLSRYHAQHPYVFNVNDQAYCVNYEPAESRSGLFGGNSNWRGPIWFPVNYLIIESLQKFHYYLGDDFKIECPTGSGNRMNLWEIASEIESRLMKIFQRDQTGNRPVYGGIETFQTDSFWRDYILFYEYFHGDNGAGLGANHQTGWTGLIAKLIRQRSEYVG